MSSPNDPPLTRREAREAQRAAERAQQGPDGDVAVPAGRGEVRRSATSGTAASGTSAPGSVPSGDPIAYRTQVRPAIPRYEPASIASVPGSAPGSAPASVPGSAPIAPPFSAPSAPRAMPPGAYRPRDFRPPGETVASAPAPARPLTFADETPDAPLQYHTQARDPEPVPAVIVEDDEVTDAVVVEDAADHAAPAHVIDEQTMTRRQLRALRAAQEVGLDGEGQNEVQSEPEPHADSHDPVVPSAAESTEAEPALAALVEPSMVPEPVAAEEPVVLPGAPVQPVGSPATGSHWSVGVHDEEDPFANTFSREVGSAASSTNALVLPEMPTGSLTGPVAGTGEIIITGMIDVPRSVASTGALPSVHDSPDLDDYFDANDSELVSTDSAPISAIHAVSGHTATRDVMGGRKPRSGTMLTTVLVASTVIMAVVAVSLFVIAAVNGVF